MVEKKIAGDRGKAALLAAENRNGKNTKQMEERQSNRTGKDAAVGN